MDSAHRRGYRAEHRSVGYWRSDLAGLHREEIGHDSTKPSAILNPEPPRRKGTPVGSQRQ